MSIHEFHEYLQGVAVQIKKRLRGNIEVTFIARDTESGDAVFLLSNDDLDKVAEAVLSMKVPPLDVVTIDPGKEDRALH